MANFNISPYYDDYDDAKKFLRILFRPGRAVQSRELTQLQTILQKQVERVGDHLFKEGAMVIPGQNSIDLSYHYVKLQEQYSSTDIDASQFVGRAIVGKTSGAVADVVYSKDIENSDPNTIYVKYRTGTSTLSFTGTRTNLSATITNVSAPTSSLVEGMILSGTGIPAGTYIVSVDVDTNGTSITMSTTANATSSATITGITSAQFANGEEIQTLDSDTNGFYYATTAASAATGVGSSASIEAGIYYVNGLFCIVDPQTVVLDKYSNTPSYRIGFNVVESFVTSLDDTSLVDPAQGSLNFNAPGGDRYKVELVLDKKSLSATTDETFVEIMRVRNGNIEYKLERTAYNELEKTLARRTFDESGNYTVRHFPVQVREHLKDGDNQGIYPSPDGDATKLAIGLEPGKAYVKGFEIETFSTRYVDVKKGRDTALANNLPIRAEVGNYVVVNNVRGTFNVSGYEAVTLKSIDSAGAPAATVGTAKVRAFKYVSGTIGSTATYRLYLYDVAMNSGKTFASDVQVIVSSSGAPEARGFVVLEAGEAVLKNSAKNAAIFENPQKVIATYDTGSGVDTNYAVSRVFSGTMAESGGSAITFTAGSNEVFPSYSATSYHLSLTTASSTATGNGYSSGSVIDIDADGTLTVGGSPVGKQITINIPDIAGSTVELIARVNKTVATEKTKTLQANHTEVKSAGATIQLGKADIYRLVSIVVNDSNGEDVTGRYRLDNGQRDNVYDRGRLLLNPGATLPSGNLLVTYDYFDHGSGDYFSVDSYDGVIDYSDIPEFISPTTGKQYSLRDCLDFRPRVNDAGNGYSVFTEMVIPDEDIQVDFEYYLPRIDKVFLDSEGNFKVKEGVASLNPSLPDDPADGMSLYSIAVPAYTFSTKDVTAKYIDNRNYTMRDIGALAKRIENVEYYTALSLLEKETVDLFIDDGTGENRFKNGFLVDNFTGHNVGAVSDPDYICSIDSALGVLRPAFAQKNNGLTFLSGTSTNFSKKTDILTLPYTTEVMIDQPYMSTAENVNPYQVTNWVGSVRLDPPSDTWRDVDQRPDIVINQEGNFDQITALADATRVMGTVWNEWTNSWVGDAYQSFNGNIIDTGNGLMATWGKFGYVAARNIGQARTGVRTSVVPDVVRQTVGSRVLDIATIPFMRSIDINFNASRLKPLTRVYPFFDGQPVSSYTKPTGGSNGAALYTNASGEVSGTFTIPNNDTLKFRTGNRLFRLSDSSTNGQGDVTTSAQETFSATGVVEARQDTVLAIRNGRIEQSVVTEERTITTWWDPLAQTFLINKEGGVFLDSIDLYFASKDESGLPVTVQIRNVVNGTPGQKIVPFSEVTLNPSAVTVATDTNDAPIATNFSFPDPVYLENGVEYCFVVLTNSQNYRIWTATLGEEDVVTGRRISENPYAGVMFKSQNASTWTPVQEQDITFKLNRCVFNTGVTATVNFEDSAVTPTLLPENPFYTTASSTTVTVNHPDHGLVGGSRTVIAGVTGTVNGIPAAELNGTKVVSNITVDTYDISSTTQADATGTIGGQSVTAISNKSMDVMNVIAQEMILPNTQIEWSAKTTDRTYTKELSYNRVVVNANVLFDTPRIIASVANETNSMAGAKSFNLQATMTSDVDNISPLIDTKRMSVITVGNRINSLTTDEDSSSGGASLARYITRRIALVDPAIALKVYLDASIPPDSGITLYYKTIRDDDSTLFEDIDWSPMTAEQAVIPQTNQSTFNEYSFIADNLQAFSTYAIKIVFTSNSTAKVPLVKNFRTIALGT